MAKDVTPLIDRLRTENEIMKGIETFLVNAKRGKMELKVSFSELKSSRSRTVYGTNFHLSAQRILEEIQKKEKPIKINTYEPVESQTLWIFDKDHYKEQLLQVLPLDNFFEWCNTVLKTEVEDNLDSEKFYYVSSLLFEKDIEAEFLDRDKFEIDLSDYILQVPFIKINLIKNAKN